MDILKRNVFSCLLILLLESVGLWGLPSKAMSQTVIPQPQSMVKEDGAFDVNVLTKVYTNLKGKEKKLMNKYLLSLPYHFLRGEANDTVNVIRLIVKDPSDKKNTSEAYTLSVNPHNIKVEASSGVGLFYGVQTLLQFSMKVSSTHLAVPCVQVKDQPRFGYRGLMIDISRHFMPKEFILRQIDALSYYKINQLHLHLVDGGGWRIQIKKYPKLTKLTAYRTESDWTTWRSGGRDYCTKKDKNAYGGYYTQRDIKEIVKYATIHHVNVIPEIDMPGHSEEVLAAYPELACNGRTYQNSSVLCLGKEISFRFFENVLKEIMKLFPSKYIHIGGDEADGSIWDSCPLCQKRMAVEHLKDHAALQNYFTRRIEYFLNAHNRTMIGWDEILDGDVQQRAVIMSWRGQESEVKAIKAGHRTVMTPGNYCYLDHYQDAPGSQPKAIGGYTSLKKVYEFDPIPAVDNAESLVWGVQGNLWTEYVPTTSHAEYMIYPRILALAEMGWTSWEHKTSYADFRDRALQAVSNLKSKGYNPFDLNNEVGERPESKNPISHLAVGKSVVYNSPYADKYKGVGDATLVDGHLGSWTYASPAWQGFIRDMDVVIDLGKSTDIHSISASFMQSVGPDIYIPAEILISVSDDNIHYSTIFDGDYSVTKDKDYYIRPYSWTGITYGRYIRYQAKRSPFKGWLFIDEIIVN